MGGTWQAKAGVGPMKGGGCYNKKGAFYCESPTHLVVSHSQVLLWQVPIAFFFRLRESSNPRPQGPILKWGALSLPTELLLRYPPPFMGPTPALACQVPPIHEVLGPTHLDIPLLTGFFSPPQGFEPVTKSLRSLGKHPCYQLVAGMLP